MTKKINLQDDDLSTRAGLGSFFCGFMLHRDRQGATGTPLEGNQSHPDLFGAKEATPDSTKQES